MDPQKEDAIHQEREIRIICIGAGASGLCFAYKFQRSFQKFSLVASSRIGLTK
jgi:cation diffusion facilitator CzcD-associated flavoprotein CzcO